MNAVLVELEKVKKTFRRGTRSLVHAVNGVSLAIDEGETVGLVGESGSGKSTIGRLVLGLLTADEGRMVFDGHSLYEMPPKQLRALRSEMQIVFQEPYESLNPGMSVAQIIEDPLRIHERSLTVRERRQRVLDTLEEVGLRPDVAELRPIAMSGGQQQRIGIARAIVTRPKLVVLDEPTSSLDLSVRAQILNLLGELQQLQGLTYLFISHDLATVEYLCQRVAVMYRGQIVESGSTEAVLRNPQHPYTKALMSATLEMDPSREVPHQPLVGDLPTSTEVPSGCYLVGRCPIETSACSEAPVQLRQLAPGHHVACIRVGSSQHGC